MNKTKIRHFVLTCYICNQRGNYPIYKFFQHPEIKCMFCGKTILEDVMLNKGQPTEYPRGNA